MQENQPINTINNNSSIETTISRNKKEAYELLKNNKITQIVMHGGAKKEIKINGEKKETWKLNPDLDGESAILLFNFFRDEQPKGTKEEKDKEMQKRMEKIYEEGAFSSIVPKGGTDKDLEIKKDGLIVYIDTGGKWFEIEKEGKKTKIYFDHHGEGKRKDTCATEMVYKFLKENNPKIDEIYPWLKNYVDSVNSFDNLTYLKKNKETFTKEYFEKRYPWTLNHLAQKMNTKTIINLFAMGYVESFNQDLEELFKTNGDKFANIKLKDGKTTVKEEINKEINGNEKESNTLKSIRGIERAEKFESPLLKKVVYHDFKKIQPKKGKEFVNQIPNFLGFVGTIARGGDTFVCWNKKEGTFFINSNENGLQDVIKLLNEADPGCVTDLRGVMVMGKINNLTEEKFKEILKSSKIEKTEMKKEKSIEEQIEELKQKEIELEIELAKKKKRLQEIMEKLDKEIKEKK